MSFAISVLNSIMIFELMQGRQDNIHIEVDRIIRIIHGNPKQEFKDNLHNVCKSIIRNEPKQSHLDTPQELIQKITSQILFTIIQVANIDNKQSALKCKQMAEKFVHNGAISRKQEILQMLLKLSEMNSSEQDISNLFNRSVTIEANNNSLLQIEFQVPLQSQKEAKEMFRKVRQRGNDREKMLEPDLVKQLLLVLTNITSSQILKDNDGYHLRSSLDVGQAVRTEIREIGELGWLHKKIIGFSQKGGKVRNALKLAIHEQLKEFYFWIARMEGLLQSKKLTLRKLLIESFLPEEILRWLAMILQAVEPFNGSHIISIINSYRPNGLTQVNKLLNRILSYILKPLLNYIHSWIYMGKLTDIDNEFFISENQRVQESGQWNERFKLICENIPSILDGESAKMIFSAGKSIYFLQNKCKIYYHIKTPFIKTQSQQGADVDCLDAFVSATFRNWLTTVHSQISNVLVQTLFNKFHLKYHLKSMKDFFLCGKGEFIQHLYDNLQEKLSLKKHEVSELSLDGYISDAIPKCFLDFKLPNGKGSFKNSILNRLLAKKIQFSNAVQCWDCFNFQYSLDGIQPLRVVFSPEATLNYQRIFNFLWKLKQVQQILKMIWVSISRRQSHQIRSIRNKGLRSIFHFVYILQNAMSHVITNLRSYLMVTIESRWDIFWKEIDETKNFDEILKKHHQFQLQILEIAFSTPQEKNMQISLNSIYTAINNFKIVYSRLQENFDEYYQKLKHTEERTQFQRGMMTEALQVPEFDLNKSFKDLREVKSCFDATFKSLYMQLRREGQSKITNLNALSARLDFSSYYSSTKYMV